MRNSPLRYKTEESLERKGAELHGEGRKWNMMSVQGPLESPDQGRQFFRIETSSAETLVVYRGAGERGMRKLTLFAIVGSAALPT